MPAEDPEEEAEPTKDLQGTEGIGPAGTRTTPFPGKLVPNGSNKSDRETRRVFEPTATASSRQAHEPAESESKFRGDEIVANRYRVVRFIGKGGMGEVYEVDDLELRERVALKTIRDRIAESDRALDRFKREIQLARNVTHPNVCRVFDIGHHRTGKPGQGITFLTMELLKGDTLAERISRFGRLTTNQALPLIVQMASALSAAHKAGIVHGDFKCANVILVPSSEGLRAVVTDFGLARRSASTMTPAFSTSGQSSSVTGSIAGTPNYMAPEQVRGSRITPATDIYALGTVVFEMITGSLPFVGDTPLSTAVMRLEELPTSPRKFVPDLDPKWESAILRCLKREPEGRFSSSEGLLRALGVTEAAPGANPARVRRVAAAGLAFIALVISLPQVLRYLRSPKGEMRVDVDNPQAAVLIDGKLRSHGPLLVTLDVGTHSYEVREEGKAPIQGTLNVEEGVTSKLVIVTLQKPIIGQEEGPRSPLNPATTSYSSATEPESKAAPSPAGTSHPAVSATSAAMFGKIFINSNTPGAQISVDGRSDPSWITPHTIDGLRSGEHQVNLSMAGFQQAQQKVAVEGGRTLPVTINLTAAQGPTGVVRIETNPAVVEILIDGISYGSSPIAVSLPAGQHSVAIKKDGATVWSSSIVAKPKEVTLTRVNLE